MEIEVLAKTSNHLAIKIKGEDHTLGNLLMKEALRHPKVAYASYRVPHPLREEIEFVITVQEGADVGEVLREIVDKIKSELSDFKNAVEASIR
ncbi:DNA-directed RNA polymerase subunit L [Thermosphaera chiliense]|uniref:DNA-directed RNA polymerase subunit Rpo11 n=1 Tax=Thermosphaera chiliense TaxID=3402707 RepID=A0A7M1UQS2_9CREN|nr:DNA-directed RNA polymerase subunit L [Thermosphaera aggregans]QOR94416.1 DNA-directed RNA polymerase subunit L [Thermosphaera aggregans]